MADIIDMLIGTDLPELRDNRPQARDNAQTSFESLLEPINPGTFSFGERYAVATYVAGLHQFEPAVDMYSELLLDDAPASLAHAITDAIAATLSSGPYGTYREPGLAAESQPGGSVRNDAGVLGERLAAAFDYAHLLVFHPRDSRPEVLGRLSEAGWSADDTVSLAQLVSFLTFQLRVAYGLRTLNGEDLKVKIKGRLEGSEAEWTLSDRGFTITTYEDLNRPDTFVNHALGWKPWVEPVAKADLTEEQIDSLIKPERADMPYFRLLARDPKALKARTLTDLDIFYNTEGAGVGRAEREIAATVTSRFNGCVYCASVHAGRSVEEAPERLEHVNALIDQGVDADLGSEQWNVIRDAARALTATPMAFNQGCIEKLHGVGFADLQIVDLINSVAFFNWANRLMLSLGEPEVPKRFL
ncbi:Carboxymuconolactone decarboxylase family protein [Corynebacterium faecale]|uniref:alkylhydroperoxidase domain protein n=1 Tax=Corynebacterium faecale TaxID=1758466 RepID=UPI0025B56059|nr:alkylhydroperoxidase domain protein [Corynebacterium faecale]WJY92944.1 Carboxymuconolactone decarboxylase family protein [Corynebacterium faecale]